MKYDCNVIANNNVDFVIADNIKSGNLPILIGSGANAFMSGMNFDLDEYCENNDLFRAKFKKTKATLKTASSLQEKFEIMQNFIEDVMPLCEPENLNKRTGCVFDSEPFSYMVEHKMCMCSERALVTQYLCQECDIKSYLANSYVHIQNGEQGQHTYIIFEDNNQMFVYDPANPTRHDAPRIMPANMDKTIFSDFVEAINHNSDCKDKKQKNSVGFVCEHEDGKKFLYRSFCGTRENRVGPKKLKEARLAKAAQTQIITSKTSNFKG